MRMTASTITGLAGMITRNKWRYIHDYASWHGRYPKTTRELRHLICEDHDGIVPVRRSRLNIPTAYDDPCASRNFGKSWKDYTKRRAQWDKL